MLNVNIYVLLDEKKTKHWIDFVQGIMHLHSVTKVDYSTITEAFTALVIHIALFRLYGDKS